jgi:diguanylate cyclase (GGDEF)-like protein
VLVAAAAAWQQGLRSTETLARTGGDEFTIVLPGCGDAEAEAIVRRLLADTPPVVSCSAGLVRWDGHESLASLQARADAALYRAKSDGPLVTVRTRPPPWTTAGHGGAFD